MSEDSFNFSVRFYLKLRLVFIAKIWVKGFRIEDKDVEEKIYMYMCVHTQEEKEKEREREERKRKKRKRKDRKIQAIQEGYNE
jgi:DNA replication protein DnaC